MSLAAQVVFWVSVAWLLYPYVIYPVILAVLARLYGRRYTSDERYCPTVSVLISARNEEKDIEWKITETLAWDYPPQKLEVLVASDASEDRTDAILLAMKEPRLHFIRMPQRAGKALALSRLYELATGELLVFTDANSQVRPECLRRLVRHFADARVGCVTGIEHTVRESSDTSLAMGSRAYLGCESWINMLESKFGSVLVCDGSLYCTRRLPFWPFQADLANDLEHPVRLAAEGHAILYDSEAYSVERTTTSATQEFRRRRRICAQGMLGMWRLRHCLRGLRLWQFISRKLLRWLALVPLVVALVTSLILLSNPFFAWATAGQVLFYALFLTGWLLTARGLCPPAIVSYPFYFVLANAAAFMGVLDALRGRRFSVWNVASLSRGQSAQSAKCGAQR